MLKAKTEKFDHARRDGKYRYGTLRKNLREMLETKSTVIEVKNAFEGLNNRLDTAEEKSVNLNVCHEKPNKLKHKEREKKSQSKTFKNCEMIFFKAAIPFYTRIHYFY